VPSTDIIGGIETILAKAKSNGFSSQFDMDLEVNNLIKSIFTYGIDLPLVSISTDGFALPQVYTLSMSSFDRYQLVN
jgi:hypothetical protein